MAHPLNRGAASTIQYFGPKKRAGWDADRRNAQSRFIRPKTLASQYRKITLIDAPSNHSQCRS